MTRVCPTCGTTYSEDYPDNFCVCGFELVAEKLPSAVPIEPEAAAPSAGPQTAIVVPESGSYCLALIGAEGHPIHYFPINKDATLIGRVDPKEGSFPDIDVGEWVDESAARRVSRRHALVIHSRVDGSYMIRPLPGNTGTQIETDMVQAGVDYPLTSGTRIILGGTVRLRFDLT